MQNKIGRCHQKRVSTTVAHRFAERTRSLSTVLQKTRFYHEPRYLSLDCMQEGSAEIIRENAVNAIPDIALRDW